MRFLRSNRGAEAFLLGALTLALTPSFGFATSASSGTTIDSRDDIDLAKIQAGGKVIFISSGPRQAAFRAIDDDRRTVFEFSRSDPRPTMIVKLNESKPVHRVSVVTASSTDTIDIYLLNALPSNPAELDKTKPVATISQPATAHEAVVDIAPQEARYIALRWTFSKVRTGASAIAEIGIFSDSAPERAVALVTATAEPPTADLIAGPPLVPVVSP
jgi:hypothetical protein